MSYTAPILKQSAHLSSDFTTSSVTAVDTNLLFSAAANKVYNVRIWGHLKKDTTGTGVVLQITAPTGATITGIAFKNGAGYSTAMTNTEITAVNAFISGAFGGTAATKFPFRLEFTITISSTAGSVKLAAATVTSNLATIYAGTAMLFSESTGL